MRRTMLLSLILLAGIAALRAEIAWGGDEGTVYALRFSDVF